MKRLFRYIFLIFIVYVFASFAACKSNSSSARQKQVTEMQEERKQEAVDMYEKGVENHKAKQTKRTRQRMESSKKKSTNLGYSRKTTWWQRLWGKRDKSCR